MHAFDGFPGAVAVLRDPPEGARQLIGFQYENGRAHSVHITYLAPDGQRTLVRTKAETLPVAAPVAADNPPPIVTIDTLQNAIDHIYRRRPAGFSRSPRAATAEELEVWKCERFAEFQRERDEYEARPQTPVSVLIDKIPVLGFRVDYPEFSGVELAWDGRVVHCVGETASIDVLELCSANTSGLM